MRLTSKSAPDILYWTARTVLKMWSYCVGRAKRVNRNDTFARLPRPIALSCEIAESLARNFKHGVFWRGIDKYVQNALWHDAKGLQKWEDEIECLGEDCRRTAACYGFLCSYSDCLTRQSWYTIPPPLGKSENIFWQDTLLKMWFQTYIFCSKVPSKCRKFFSETQISKNFRGSMPPDPNKIVSSLWPPPH